MVLKEKKYFIIYLSFLLVFSLIFLFDKHEVGNNWTISEWLINYQGGFTRRGLLGDLAFYLGGFFDVKIRFAIFLLQSLFYFIFIILTFNFFKKIKINSLSRLSIYVPIFLLFPLAKLDGLGRKETAIYIMLIIFLNLASNNFNKKYCNFFTFFILPISFFIYEPIIFFFPFIIFILFLKNNNQNIIKRFTKVFLIILPSIIIFLFVITNPISEENHEKMCLSLMANFKEDCGMALSLLKTKSGIVQQFTANYPFYKFNYLLRYLLIIFIGFFPLFLLSANYKFNKKINPIFSFKTFLPVFIILLFLSFSILMFMQDWGRAVNMAYTFSIFTFFFLIKNNYIYLKQGKFYLLVINFFKNKKYYFIVFFFYCFCWNIKILMSEKVAFFQIYKIVTKSIKILLSY